MCKSLEEIMEEGRIRGRAKGISEIFVDDFAEGYVEGYLEGYEEDPAEAFAQGENAAMILYRKLLSAGRISEAQRAFEDKEYREELMQELGID